MTNRIDRLTRIRTARRRAQAEACARSVLARLAGLGAKVVITGSLADGRFARHSDVDFLVLDSGGLSDGRLLCEVEDAMGGLPFDLLWIDRLRPEVAATMLEKAHAGVVRQA